MAYNTIDAELLQRAEAALDVVSRERIGALGAVTLITAPEPDAKLEVPVTPSMSAATATVRAVDAASAKTITKVEVVTDKFKEVEWTLPVNGDINAAIGSQIIQSGLLSQAFRTLTNEMSRDVVQAALYGAGSATATASPFASSASDLIAFRTALAKNGADEGRSFIMGSGLAGALMAHDEVVNLGFAGENSALSTGLFARPLYGFGLFEDNSLLGESQGTGAGYVANGGEPAGETTIAVKTGTGTILAGDTVKIGNYYYKVATPLSSGSFTISEGLKEVLADGGDVKVVKAGAIALSRSSVVFGSKPANRGDAAMSDGIVIDPLSGVPFRLAIYGLQHAVKFSVQAAWGAKAIKSAHIVKNEVLA